MEELDVVRRALLKVHYFVCARVMNDKNSCHFYNHHIVLCKEGLIIYFSMIFIADFYKQKKNLI